MGWWVDLDILGVIFACVSGDVFYQALIDVGSSSDWGMFPPDGDKCWNKFGSSTNPWSFDGNKYCCMENNFEI